MPLWNTPNACVEFVFLWTQFRCLCHAVGACFQFWATSFLGTGGRARALRNPKMSLWLFRKSSLTEHGALGKQRIGIWTGLLTLPLPSSFPLLPPSYSTACVVTYRLPRLLPLTSTLSRLTAHPAPRHLQPHPGGSRRLSRGPNFYRPSISRHSFMNALIIAPNKDGAYSGNLRNRSHPIVSFITP